jgi:CheY-like chemotaxis protein
MSDSGEKKQLGRILLQQKLVTPGELDQLLEKQRRSPGTRLASAAASSGKLEDVDLLRALSEQLGVPAIDLSQVVVPLTNLKLVPYDVAKQYLILPFSVKENEMWLAMADPHDKRVVDEIEFVTGRTVAPYVALHEHLGKVVEEAYQALERGESYYVGPHAPPEYLAQLGIRPKEAPPSRRGPTLNQPPTASGGRPDSSSGAHAAPATPAAAREDRFGPRGPTRHEPAAAEVDFSDLFDEPKKKPAAAPPKSRPDIGALDPAFDSRVGPLPKTDDRSTGPKSATKTVLVVDDEDDIRRMLRRVLQERGYRVVEASRGTEALQAVRDHVLDCILLDAMLPEIHGFDICRRIKSSQKYGHIPIIMVSAIYRGWRFAEDLREAYGVTAFLEKPFKISDVVIAVERAIEGKPVEVADQDEQLGPEAASALSRGMDAYHRGDLEQAIVDLRGAIGLEPNSFRLHYHLGLLYGRRDNVFEAIQEMETALNVSPRNFPALKNLAVLYQRAGFKHKAVESWERALRAAPDEETRRGIKEHLMGLL